MHKCRLIDYKSTTSFKYNSLSHCLCNFVLISLDQFENFEISHNLSPVAAGDKFTCIQNMGLNFNNLTYFNYLKDFLSKRHY